MSLPAPNDAIKIQLADQTLAVQLSLARKVSQIVAHRVYIYDSSKFFCSDTEVVIYDNVRTLLKQGKIALLSQAAQNVVPSSAIYRSLIPPSHISEDSIGVYYTS